MSIPGMIYVVPTEGAAVRDPRTRQMIGPEGCYVPEGEAHWRSLLNFGDLRHDEGRAPKREPAPPAVVEKADAAPGGKPDDAAEQPAEAAREPSAGHAE